MSPEVAVRAATPDEFVAVLSVLEGALLDVDPETVRAAIREGNALVAVDGDRVVGSLVASPADEDGRAKRSEGEGDGSVPDEDIPTEGPVPRHGGAHVEAVAVRPARRGRGVGRALVEAAAARYGTLTATCRGAVVPFYESLGFDVEPAEADRWSVTRLE